MAFDGMSIYGKKIIPHQLAREVRTEWRIERNPIKKRRRNWLVVKNKIDRPGIIMAGDVIYMHPDLIAKFRQTNNAAQTPQP